MENVTQNIAKIVALEKELESQATRLEKISGVFAKFCSTPAFIIIHLTWFITHVVLNSIPGGLTWDPFPYSFLTLVTSLESIILSSLLFISQNHLGQLTERRNHLDLQINLLAEQETTKILRILICLAKKQGIQIIDTDLTRTTDPQDVIKELDKNLKTTPGGKGHDARPGTRESPRETRNADSLD